LSHPFFLDRDALLVAMAVAPGVYARNRYFSLHTHPEVRYAKARAAILRGLVRQLAGKHGGVTGLVIERGPGRARVRYRVESLRLERQAELSDVEAACFFYLAGRAGSSELRPSPEDRALLHAALRKLGGHPQTPGPDGFSGPEGMGELLDEG
jgi:hypothetical protein